MIFTLIFLSSNIYISVVSVVFLISEIIICRVRERKLDYNQFSQKNCGISRIFLPHFNIPDILAESQRFYLYLISVLTVSFWIYIGYNRVDKSHLSKSPTITATEDDPQHKPVRTERRPAMNIEEIRKQKQLLGWTNQELADRADVPLGTVQKALGGATKYPRRSTLDKLTAAIENGLKTEDRPASIPSAADRPYSMSGEKDRPGSSSDVCEKSIAYERQGASPRWPRQGSYTVSDYEALPDEVRVELIDGVFYDMSAPTFLHQIIAGRVYVQLINFMDSHEHKNCTPGISPLDVQLDQDDRTMVQPDVIILCDQKKNTIKRIYGAPDFVLEVLSPSTRRKDMIKKLDKYMNAGVREYWMADPEKEMVTVFDFSSENFPDYYTFDDQIPVAISGGACVIDFRPIHEELKEMKKYQTENEE